MGNEKQQEAAGAPKKDEPVVNQTPGPAANTAEAPKKEEAKDAVTVQGNEQAGNATNGSSSESISQDPAAKAATSTEAVDSFAKAEESEGSAEGNIQPTSQGQALETNKYTK